MRRRLLIILIFLLAGAVVNVAVAWTCAIKVNPLNGKVKDALENVLGMQGFAVMRFSRSGATLITCYRCNGALHPSDVQGDPAALLDYWTGFHQPTPEYESGTTLKEERIAHGCGWPMLTFWCETYAVEAGRWQETIVPHDSSGLAASAHLARLRRQHALLRRDPVAAHLRPPRPGALPVALPPATTRPVPVVRVPDGRVGGVYRVRQGATAASRGDLT
jgi:hypothetical protein